MNVLIWLLIGAGFGVAGALVFIGWWVRRQDEPMTPTERRMLIALVEDLRS